MSATRESISIQASSARSVASTTASSVLLEAFVRAGVRHAFGVPGGTISPIFDALREFPELRLVSTRHETAAAFAALGVARATGRPALVLATSGPGLTNALTGIAAAHYENVPMIVVVGDVPVTAAGRGALQDGGADALGVHAILGSFTRWRGTVSRADGAAGAAAKACAAALGPRPGPVLLSLPLDVGATSIAHAPRVSIVPATPPSDPIAVRDAASVLGAAQRPLLVLGNGARNAWRESVEIAERLGMAVIVTSHGKGAFPEDHPNFLGIVGLGQHPSVLDWLIDPPDVTLVVGSRLNDLATNGWSVPIGGQVATLQLDVDPLLLGVNARTTHAIVADASAGLRDLLLALPTDVQRPVRRFPGVRRERDQAARSEATPITPQRLLRGLSRAIPDAVWVADIGEHLAHAIHSLQVRAGAFHDFLGFGSMGSGVCAALGMKLAKPSSRVVCLCGDGGFTSYAGELLTAVEQRLGLLYVVFNDGCWNMVEHGFDAVYGAAPTGLTHHVADLAALARSMGANGIVVRSPAELDALPFDTLLAGSVPTVLDVRIDRRECLTAATRSAGLKHFSGVGR